MFVDGLDGVDEEHEAEADRFAADQLIPPAAALGIAAGIVVGRMQHEGWLPRTHLNGLKVSYQWLEDVRKSLQR
jgi:hypothetical protein